jgi:hypothetical protein
VNVDWTGFGNATDYLDPNPKSRLGKQAVYDTYVTETGMYYTSVTEMNNVIDSLSS